MKDVLLQTNLPGVTLVRRGKVRDIYDLGDKLLIVATDRISAYDVVMPNGIPGKGVILSLLSLFWFYATIQIVRNHLITGKIWEFPLELLSFTSQLNGRSMLVKKTTPCRVECVVRGYLAGSGWRDYQKTGKICGIELPEGLRESERLPEPIFTPATKAETGHDENISFEQMSQMVGEERAIILKTTSIDLYNMAANYAETKGIIIADTKFEFGEADGSIMLIDEALTPDSSRFWPADQYEPGRPQESFDKQFLRDWLDSIGWDRKPPAPELPEWVVQKTAAKYQEAYRRLVEAA